MNQNQNQNLNVQMDEEHLEAVTKLKQLLEPITEEMCHINNVDMARLTFPHNVIPYDVEPEVWKPLNQPNWVKDKYIVSSWGRVYNNKENFFLASSLNDKGYVKVSIQRSDEFHRISLSGGPPVHRLVALTFLPEHEHNETVNHIDLDKLNNCAYNLEFLSNVDNVKHAYKHNARPKKDYRYFTKEEIDEIRRKYNEENYTLVKLSKEYDKNLKTIRKIVRNISYNDDFWDNLGFSSDRVKHYINLRKNQNHESQELET